MKSSGVCAVLGVRVVATASLKLVPLVGAEPSHAKRVVLAELSRGRIGRPAEFLMRARERQTNGTATTQVRPVKRRART